MRSRPFILIKKTNNHALNYLKLKKYINKYKKYVVYDLV